LNFYATAIDLAIIILVTSLYGYLFLQYRQRFLVYWTGHWLLLFAKHFIELVILPLVGLRVQELPVAFVLLNQLSILAAALLLLLGTAGFFRERIHRFWKFLFALSLVASIVMLFVQSTFIAGSTFALYFMALVMIWSGVKFIRYKEIDSFGRYLAGGAFLLWGIHILDYPFIRNMEAMVPWGFLLASFLSLLTAQGLLFIHFERMRQDLISSKGELENAENSLWYLNLHDPLTGLYNRLYFEERMNSIQKQADYSSVGIVVLDIEGLKLINDTLGHATGDLILTEAANLISLAYPQSDTIARIGGDDFAAIVLNCHEEQLARSANYLNQLIQKHNFAKPDVPMGISIGCKLETDKSRSLFEVFKEAENAMYRNRLKNSNIARIAIVNALSRAIQEKEYIAKDHSSTMKDIMELMGLALGMPAEKIEELRQLALFHDIGKVGIPEHILAKPGPLKKEEMEEMRRHSEIGARIAQTSPQLAHLQDYILKHHERWDGKGYPLGLSGQEIPLECRILALADSYDAMTSHRPYRPALSHEQAVEELRKCSGTQFDPNLVELFIRLLNEHRELRGENSVHPRISISEI